MRDVFVANEQDDVAVDEHRFVDLARLTAEEEGVDASAELSVLFVDRTSMAGLKERYLGEQGATDVLAFPMDEHVSDDAPYMLGDIVICPDVAREQAESSGGPVADELDLLFVHGFLHLLGYDHATPQEAKQMRHRERRILQRFRRQPSPDAGDEGGST